MLRPPNEGSARAAERLSLPIMRDPWGLNERLFAVYYPRLLARAERAGQAETRRSLLAEAEGRTVELGAGGGVNVPHYTEAVSELVLTEPSPHMIGHVQASVAAHSPPCASVSVLPARAEAMPFETGSVDTIVATFVLCTTPDPAAVLDEIHRLLRPGGRYLFMEHVHAGEATMLGRIQDLVELPHRYVAAGCHPNRRTESLLSESELDVVRLERDRQPRSPPTVRPRIVGVARRRS